MPESNGWRGPLLHERIADYIHRQSVKEAEAGGSYIVSLLFGWFMRWSIPFGLVFLYAVDSISFSTFVGGLLFYVIWGHSAQASFGRDLHAILAGLADDVGKVDAKVEEVTDKLKNIAKTLDDFETVWRRVHIEQLNKMEAEQEMAKILREAKEREKKG